MQGWAPAPGLSFRINQKFKGRLEVFEQDFYILRMFSAVKEKLFLLNKQLMLHFSFFRAEKLVTIPSPLQTFCKCLGGGIQFLNSACLTFIYIYFVLNVFLGHKYLFLLGYLFLLCTLFWFRNSLLFFNTDHPREAGWAPVNPAMSSVNPGLTWGFCLPGCTQWFTFSIALHF